eukprot:scaffold17300_cov94-Isochrysis_galbana.AAC.2
MTACDSAGGWAGAVRAGDGPARARAKALGRLHPVRIRSRRSGAVWLASACGRCWDTGSIVPYQNFGPLPHAVLDVPGYASHALRALSRWSHAATHTTQPSHTHTRTGPTLPNEAHLLKRMALFGYKDGQPVNQLALARRCGRHHQSGWPGRPHRRKGLRLVGSGGSLGSGGGLVGGGGLGGGGRGECAIVGRRETAGCGGEVGPSGRAVVG